MPATSKTSQILAMLALFVPLLGGLSLAPNPSAASETASFHIGPGGIEPRVLFVDGSRALDFVNDSGGSTRIVFDKRSAEKIACSFDRDSATRSRAGQFVLNDEGGMSCAVSARRLSFTVMQQKPGGGVTKTKAKIAVQR